MRVRRVPLAVDLPGNVEQGMVIETYSLGRR